MKFHYCQSGKQRCVMFLCTTRFEPLFKKARQKSELRTCDGQERRSVKHDEATTTIWEVSKAPL